MSKSITYLFQLQTLMGNNLQYNECVAPEDGGHWLGMGTTSEDTLGSAADQSGWCVPSFEEVD
jgi:hypothetical protein